MSRISAWAADEAAENGPVGAALCSNLNLHGLLRLMLPWLNLLVPTMGRRVKAAEEAGARGNFPDEAF